MEKSSKIKRGLVWLLVIVLLVLTALSYFFVANEAPIITGQVRYAIPYKENLTLDIYEPIKKRFEKSPVVVFFHGGGWVVGRKESINMNRFNKAVNLLREKGYVVISPAYTLGTEESPFPNCIQDGFDVIKWVEENADEQNFDLTNVGVFGESAGAHIAMLVAYANPMRFGAVEYSITINYVIDVYGPTDMGALYNSQTVDSVKVLIAELPTKFQEHFDLPRRLLGFDPASDSLRTKTFMDTYSPLTYVKSGLPPTLIIQGTDDILVPINQSLALDSLLVKAQIQKELRILQGTNHAFIGASQKQMDSVQQWIVSFVESHYN